MMGTRIGDSLRGLSGTQFSCVQVVEVGEPEEMSGTLDYEVWFGVEIDVDIC